MADPGRNMRMAAHLEQAGMPDRMAELTNLIRERLGTTGDFTEDKEGDDNALILWAYLEIIRLRGLFEALDAMDEEGTLDG
jgi:hypothetical protein